MTWAEKLREGHYDLLTTDLKMQDASGYEVLELLRTSDIGNSRTIPVMVVTGSKSITCGLRLGAVQAVLHRRTAGSRGRMHR